MHVQPRGRSFAPGSAKDADVQKKIENFNADQQNQDKQDQQSQSQNQQQQEQQQAWAAERLEHNRRLWNVFEDVRGDLTHEYPAVRSEAVSDIEAVVRGEGVSDRYAEGMADAYRKAVDEHRQYLEDHPEKRADDSGAGSAGRTEGRPSLVGATPHARGD